MSEKLLNHCPFCGGTATVWQNFEGLWFVSCDECGCNLGEGFQTEEEAIDVWNTRREEKEAYQLSWNIEVTNRDWLIRNLKQMSDREFAKVFCESTGCSSCPSGGISSQCTDKLIDWLKQEHKEG